jgi:S1-C subfamily serine protease
MSDELPPVTGPADEPTSERPSASGYPPPAAGAWASPPAWGSPPQSGWNYGYGGLWTPPPEPPPARGPNPARRVLATIAIIVLVLVSGSIGAVISAAVHDNTGSPPAASPFIGGSSNNPFGSDSATPDTGSTATDAVASKVSPALVNIYTTIETSTGRGQAAGTGMVITSSGEVLTNNHVIADASTVRVELVATGDTHTAKVLGYDVKDDVALLKIDNVSDLQTVSFADAAKVAIGDSVVAIGNAGGRGGDPTVTSGSVTALGQKVTAGDSGTGVSETLVGMIEISAPIEPGDSGGPLVNSDGQVIGMNTAAATSDRFSGQASSTAFAIPINRAARIAEQIRNHEESANVHVGERGLLGVRVQEIDSQSACQVTVSSGALVAGAQSGSPADGAGLSACDVIVQVDGKNIASTSDLNEAMFRFHPDETVSVRWVDPGGDSHHADLTLIAGPPA